MNTELQKAEATGETSVRLEYSDGLGATLDLAPALRGPIFEPVRAPDYFARFNIDSDTLRWPNGADIDPSVLRLWAEKGRVLSQEETDVFFLARASDRSAA
jgi:hypothetical protein